MSLDIGLASDRPFYFAPGPVVSFDDDGYYWFLHPLFEELQQKTGQYIDLYDGAVFSGPTLGPLRETLAEARRRIEAQPETWQVHVGDNIGSYLNATPPTPIYKAVRKDRFLRMIEDLDKLIDAAEQTGGRIVCAGD